jgi:hypothetical protein
MGEQGLCQSDYPRRGPRRDGVRMAVGDKHNQQMPSTPFSSQFENGCLIMKGQRPLGGDARAAAIRGG